MGKGSESHRAWKKVQDTKDTFERIRLILFCFWIFIDLRKTLKNRRQIDGGSVLQQGRTLLLRTLKLISFCVLLFEAESLTVA